MADQRLTDAQSSTLQLILRSPDRGEGWRQCSEILFAAIIVPMPHELVEVNTVTRQVRLTTEGASVARWLLGVSD